MASSAASARSRIGTAGLRQVGTAAAALAAQHLGADADEIDGVVRGGEVGGDADHETGLAFLADADNGDDAGAHLLLAVVDQPAQILRRHAVHHAGEQLDIAELAHRRGRRRTRAAAKRQLAFGVGQLAFELAALVDDGGQALDDLVGRDLQQLGRLAHALVLGGEIGARGLAVSASMRRTPEATALSLTILSRPISPVRRDMGAAAQLDGISVAGPFAVGVHAHDDDADLLAVFLAEQRQRALGDGLVGRHEMGLDRRVLHDHGVDQVLDPRGSRRGSSASGARNRIEPPGLDQRALLRHMGAQHLAQRLMQQMGRRMMGAGRRAARMVNFQQHLVADFQRALLHHAVMQEQPMKFFLRVADRELGAGGA